MRALAIPVGGRWRWGLSLAAVAAVVAAHYAIVSATNFGGGRDRTSSAPC